MSASDIFSYCLPFISAMGPAILVTAIVANADSLIKLLYRTFGRDFHA